MTVCLRRIVFCFSSFGLLLHVFFDALSSRHFSASAISVLPLIALPYLLPAIPALFTCNNPSLACLLGALSTLAGFDIYIWRDWSSSAVESTLGNGIVWLLECGYSFAATLLALFIGIVHLNIKSRPAIQRALPRICFRIE